MSGKCKAVLFINLYCVFDTVDNINVKIAMEKDVGVMDLTIARLLFNFVSACAFVCFAKKHVTKDVPTQFKSPLIYRSIMLLIGQIMNVYAISLLPLGLLTILQNT